MELTELLLKNSSWTWNRLREARNLNIQIGEESITDFLVLNLKKNGIGKIDVKSFTRHEESVNGADWELWFTGPSRKWFGVRVQAKVIKLKTAKYEHLNHSNKNGKQVDLLISDSAKNGLIPIYCMYTNWDVKKYTPSYKCTKCKPSVRWFGNSLLAPTMVKSLQKNGHTSLTKVINHLRPFHCAFCEGTKTLKGDLPQLVFQSLYYNNLFEEKALLNKELVDRYLKKEPPYYITGIDEEYFNNNQKDFPYENESFSNIDDPRLKKITIIKEI